MRFIPSQIEKIREAYFFISEFKKMLENLSHKHEALGGQIVNEYHNYIQDFRKFIPNVITQFNPSSYLIPSNPFDFPGNMRRGLEYSVSGLLLRIIKDLSALKNSLDSSEETSPLTPKKNFSFIGNSDLRVIVERDYVWVNKCLAVEAWKPVIILSGGLIEGLILDTLLADQDKAKSSSKAPKETDLKKWNLENLIDVAVELSIINPGAEKLGDAVRHYRNLIHPGNELRFSGLKIEPEEARIAVEVLNMVIRDLQNRK